MLIVSLFQSSEDSEAERAKEEERKAEEEKNQKESAASTKGTNTPSGRPKHTDALKKSTASRKRPGSPNASDASGTDTSRKKVKNKHQTSHPTPQPTSRPISPSAAQVSAKNNVREWLIDANALLCQAGKKRIRNPALAASGSGSDIDAGAVSGAELSESGKTKKLRLNPPAAPSRAATPQGSRAASPAIGNPSFGSRASSPEGPMRGKSLALLTSELWSMMRVLILLNRTRSGIDSCTFRQSNIPYPGGDPRRHSAVWHSQQRSFANFPPSHWRVKGESPTIHCNCQGC